MNTEDKTWRDGAARPKAAMDPAVWTIPLVLVPLILWGGPLYAILAGAGLSLAVNRAVLKDSAAIGKLALQAAIVLLGFNLDAQSMWQVSQEHAAVIALYVIGTLAAGLALGRLFGVELILTKLIAAGTAICGGTAIATLCPIIKARGEQMAVALTIVFFLNMVALLTFPWIGAALEMTQAQFGVWSALAVHDTSSVVAVATVYGEEAAEVATTLKLGRTLWLIPLVLGFGLMHEAERMKIRVPGFIILFVLASIAGTLLGSRTALPEAFFDVAQFASKALIVVALFFVGLECTRQTLRTLRSRVVWLALALWSAVVPVTLLIALNFA